MDTIWIVEREHPDGMNVGGGSGCTEIKGVFPTPELAKRAFDFAWSKPLDGTAEARFDGTDWYLSSHEVDPT